MIDFDVSAIREQFRLLALLQHCLVCEVEWRGGGECWSCGRRGRVGSLPLFCQLVRGVS